MEYIPLGGCRPSTFPIRREKIPGLSACRSAQKQACPPTLRCRCILPVYGSAGCADLSGPGPVDTVQVAGTPLFAPSPFSPLWGIGNGNPPGGCLVFLSPLWSNEGFHAMLPWRLCPGAWNMTPPARHYRNSFVQTGRSCGMEAHGAKPWYQSIQGEKASCTKKFSCQSA